MTEYLYNFKDSNLIITRTCKNDVFFIKKCIKNFLFGYLLKIKAIKRKTLLKKEVLKCLFDGNHARIYQIRYRGKIFYRE